MGETEWEMAATHWREETKKARNEIERLRGLLFEELHHDHDCHTHNGSDPDYDAGYAEFYDSNGNYKSGVEQWAKKHKAQREPTKEKQP